MLLCWPWSPYEGNTAQASALMWGTNASGHWLPPPRGADLPVPIIHDGIALGERNCSARGEILRPLQDQLQRRRFASACPSIKDESVGSEDDQTPL